MITRQEAGTAEVHLDAERRHGWDSAQGQRYRPAGRWPMSASVNPRVARQVLPFEPVAPKIARDFARDALVEWTLGELYDDVALVVSELVTNALRHGPQTSRSAQTWPVQLVLLGHRRRLVAVVTDPGEQTPTVGDPDHFAEEGRGLLVVKAISDAWGFAPLSTGGKAVWASFDLPKPLPGAG